MKNIEELHATFEYEEDYKNDPIFILTSLRIYGETSFLSIYNHNRQKVWLTIELPTKIITNILLTAMHNELPFVEGVQGKVIRYTETYWGEVTIRFECDRTKILVRDENFVNLTPKVASYYLNLIQEALA